MAITVEQSEFTFTDPTAAISSWLERTKPSPTTETIPLAQAAGRILAREVCSDRPSPPCTVSAMDGYIFESADLMKAGRVEIVGEVCIGQAPPEFPKGKSMRIFTGAPVPDDCHVVIKREDVAEFETQIILPEAVVNAARNGQNIRYQGENSAVGSIVVSSGTLITMPVAAALAGFGYAEVAVKAPVRVTIFTTGDELRSVGDRELSPWQIRNSNGPALQHFFSPCPWISVQLLGDVTDNFAATCAAFEQALGSSDAVIATGGVSMGDHDYVPDAVRAVGGEIIFHKLPVRPGKPMLAALGPQGQVIAGLPGNPVSVMVAARRTTYPILQKKAGFDPVPTAQPLVSLTGPIPKPLHLYWYRPVRLLENGIAELVSMMGSGDFGASAQSDGFVEISPNATHAGPWPYWSWRAD